jgi:hypothetical protein
MNNSDYTNIKELLTKLRHSIQSVETSMNEAQSAFEELNSLYNQKKDCYAEIMETVVGNSLTEHKSSPSMSKWIGKLVIRKIYVKFPDGHTDHSYLEHPVLIISVSKNSMKVFYPGHYDLLELSKHWMNPKEWQEYKGDVWILI